MKSNIWELTGLVALNTGLISTSYIADADETVIRRYNSVGVKIAEIRIPFRLDVVAGRGERMAAVTYIGDPTLVVYRVAKGVE